MFSMWCVGVCWGSLWRFLIGDGIIPVLRARGVMSRMRRLGRAGGVVLGGVMRGREMRRKGMGLRLRADLVLARKGTVMREILQDSVGLQLDRSFAYLRLGVSNALLAVEQTVRLESANDEDISLKTGAKLEAAY